jgi:hypothetical protein
MLKQKSQHGVGKRTSTFGLSNMLGIQTKAGGRVAPAAGFNRKK